MCADPQEPLRVFLALIAKTPIPLSLPPATPFPLSLFPATPSELPLKPKTPKPLSLVPLTPVAPLVPEALTAGTWSLLLSKIPIARRRPGKATGIPRRRTSPEVCHFRHLAPLCRHHHRCKQADGWQLDQPEPGVLRWRTPARRTYGTSPTVYPM
jgi:hypothetical protein